MPASGLIVPSENFFKDVFNKTKKSNRIFHVAGDFIWNLLDNDKCWELQEFSNLIYENSVIPAITKSTKVSKQSNKTIDHILTNRFVEFYVAIILVIISLNRVKSNLWFMNTQSIFRLKSITHIISICIKIYQWSTLIRLEKWSFFARCLIWLNKIIYFLHAFFAF